MTRVEAARYSPLGEQCFYGVEPRTSDDATARNALHIPRHFTSARERHLAGIA